MKAVFIGLFALTCLVMTLFLPWAELGLPLHLPGATQVFEPLSALKDALTSALPQITGDKEVFANYVYALFLALALVAAAVGIHLAGREDSEEKTVLPLKK